MSTKGPALSEPGWHALRALASAKYAEHTPAVSAEEALELSRHGLVLRIAGALAITQLGERVLAESHRFVAGRYRTHRDGGAEYSYEAEWQVTPRGMTWNASVRKGDAPAGRPAGQYLGQPQNPAAAVRDFVEAAIEKRAGVN